MTVVHVGPVTAFRAGRSGELLRLISQNTIGIETKRCATLMTRLVVRPRDKVLLFFGEIDVRVHFESRRHEYGTSEKLAHYLASRLTAEAHALASATRASVGISSVTPPSKTDDNPDFPQRGSDQDRLFWSRLLNEELDAACKRLGLVFVDTYSSYSDQHGRLRDDLSDGGVHVRPDAASAMVAACRRAFDL